MANSIKLDLIDDDLVVNFGADINIRTEDCTVELDMKYEQLETIYEFTRKFLGEKTVDELEDRILSLENKIDELQAFIDDYCEVW